MEKKDSAITMEQTYPELFSLPHIADKLLLLVLGTWQPDAIESDRLIDHLLGCHDCRSALRLSISIEPVETKIKRDPKTRADELQSRFVEILDSTDAKEYVQLSAFAELQAEKGRAKAEERFPALSAHLKGCSICEAALDDILEFLHEPEGAR